MFLVPVFNTTRTIVKSGRLIKDGFSTSVLKTLLFTNKQMFAKYSSKTQI